MPTSLGNISNLLAIVEMARKLTDEYSFVLQNSLQLKGMIPDITVGERVWQRLPGMSPDIVYIGSDNAFAGGFS